MTDDLQSNVVGAEVQGESPASPPEGADVDGADEQHPPDPTTYDLMLEKCYRDAMGNSYFWDAGENGNQPIYLDTKDAIDAYRYKAFLERGGWPKKKDAKDAVDQLRIVTKKTKEVKPLHLRVQKYGEHGVELKLNGKESVKITADAINTGDHVGHFWASPDELPLAMPDMDGSIEPFLGVLGVTDPDEKVLVTGFLLVSLFPNIQYPILIVEGSEGSGKTAFCGSLVRITDPYTTTQDSYPKSKRDLYVCAGSRRVLCFENVSVINHDMSDGHCLIATGGSARERKLYTNTEVSSIKLSNPQIVSGIDNLVSRDDMRDRSILIKLPVREQRLSDGEYQCAIEATLSGALGHLISAMQTAIQNLAGTVTPADIRMTDAARLVTAAESAFGWESGAFAAAYRRNHLKSMQQSLNVHPVFEVLDRLLQNNNRRIEKTATELLESLESEAATFNKRLLADEKWPKSASALSGELRRLEGSLAKVGIRIESDRTANSRKLIITDSRGGAE